MLQDSSDRFINIFYLRLGLENNVTIFENIKHTHNVQTQYT